MIAHLLTTEDNMADAAVGKPMIGPKAALAWRQELRLVANRYLECPAPAQHRWTVRPGVTAAGVTAAG